MCTLLCAVLTHVCRRWHGPGQSFVVVTGAEQAAVWTRLAVVSPPPRRAPRSPPCLQCSTSNTVPTSFCAKAPLYDKVSKVRLMGERFQAFVSTTDISKLPSDTKTADCQAQGKVDECLLLPALADAVLRNAPTPASVTGGTDTSVLSLRFCIRRKAEHFFINSGPWIFPVL